MAPKVAVPKKKTSEKAAIKKVIDAFMTAFCKKDVKAMMSHYAADVVVYDVKPPFQIKGAVAWRHAWEACLPFFPESFQVEIQDLYIHAGNDVALSHYQFKLTGTSKDEAAAQTWIRTTTGYKKVQGRWKIVHEHGSVPFNPHTREATFNNQ